MFPLYGTEVVTPILYQLYYMAQIEFVCRESRIQGVAFIEAYPAVIEVRRNAVSIFGWIGVDGRQREEAT